MSLQVTMDIYFNESEKNSYGDIFNILISSKWRNFQNDKFKMIMLGDEDYSWIDYTMAVEEAEALLNNKQSANEVGGVEVLMFVDNRISISLSINRKTKLTFHTDIEWYMEKLLIPLEENLSIESFEFIEQA